VSCGRFGDQRFVRDDDRADDRASRIAAHAASTSSVRSAPILARKLTEAIWHMLTTNQPFDPAAAGGATRRLAA
jgi:hypothetical protein